MPRRLGIPRFNVFRLVVASVSVLVMPSFPREQGTAQLLCQNKPVFVFIRSIGHPDTDIASLSNISPSRPRAASLRAVSRPLILRPKLLFAILP